MALYLQKVHELLGAFQKYEVKQIPRAQNAHADALARLATTRDADFLGAIPVEFLPTPSKEEKNVMMAISVQHDSHLFT